MFLVLTRATNVTSAELRRLKDEAYRQFSSKLDKRNIFLVDSKAELYAKQFAGVDDVKSELQKLNKTGTLDDFVVRAYTDTSGLFGDGDKNDFIRALKEKSRFAEIYTALESFGRKAHYILLGDLLDSICKLYNKLWNNTNVQMDMFRQKAEDPIKLAKKIGEVNQEIEVIKDKMRNGFDEVVHRFRGDEGLIRKTAEKAKKDFSSEISSINANSNQAFNELERHSQKKIDEFKKLAETLQQKAVAEFDKELIILSDKSTIPFESLKPDFTHNTFDEIREATRSKAKETHSFETGTTFKKTHTYSEYSQNKHYLLIKNNITERLEYIKNDLIDYLEEFVEKLGNCYIKALFENAKAKKDELDSIYEAKANAEQIIEIVDSLNEFTKRFKDAELEADKIKGGIKKMYSDTISPKVDKMFNDLRKKIDPIITESNPVSYVMNRIVQLVASETSSRSKSILSDMLFDLNDTLFETPYFNDVSRRNNFTKMKLRKEILDKYQFSSTTINFKETSRAAMAISIGGAVFVVGGIAEIIVVLIKGLEFSNLVPLPVGILVATALGAALADYLVIEPTRNKSKFKNAVNKYLENTQKQFLLWFDKVEIYFNKRVEEFKSAN